MALGLNDLDSTVATAFGECLKQLYFHRDEKLVVQKQLLTALRKQRWLGPGGKVFIPVVASYACVMIGAQLSSQPWLAGGLFGVSFLLSGASIRRSLRRDLLLEFHNRLPSEVLQAALPLLSLSSLEILYTRTVVLVLALEPLLEEQTAREVLQKLNGLLESHRQLATQRLGLDEAVAQHPVAALEGEQANLQQRLQEIPDSVTRQSLQQSLQMNTTRLEDARLLARDLQRAVAQQEAIEQTIAAVHASLTRMQTAPSASATNTTELTQTLTQLNRQTQALESAVQEVASLSQQA